jgi:hypothetical protein
MKEKDMKLDTKLLVDRLKKDAASILLSTSEFLSQKITSLSRTTANSKINEAVRVLALNPEAIKQDIVNAKNRELADKRLLLAQIYVENDPSLDRQMSGLEDYILLLKDQIIEPDNSKILKQQEASSLLLNRLRTEASRQKRKSLANTTDIDGVPLISSRQITEPVAKQIQISDLAELAAMCPELDSTIKLSGAKSWPDFFCWCYAIGANDQFTKEKAEAIKIMGKKFQEKFNLNIQVEYNSQIGQFIEKTLENEDLIDTLASEEETKIYNKLGSLESRANRESALCVWELELNSNDEFLNPEAVLNSIKAAKIDGKELVVRFVRSLRWCYPNKELEIPPTAGDWDTLDVNGNSLTRKESTEIEKLKIFRTKLLDVLDFYTVPYSVVLLSTGDYEMTGPGYNFSDNDPRCINARAYIEDLKARVPQWNIFRGVPTIQTVKELIATNQALFDSILEITKNGIEGLFDINQNVLDFCGYTQMAMGWIFEREDGNRTPFISWWTRKKSLDFTKYKTWYEMAFGLFIAKLDDNCLLVVSGNRASGLPLSKSKLIDSTTKPLGVMSIRLANDGEVSDDFAAKTLQI